MRPGRNEPGQIVDMSVGVVVQQPRAQPDHSLEAEVLLELAPRLRRA